MKIINKKSKTTDFFNWSILLIISLTSIMAGIYRDGFAALFPFLQKEFHLTRTQLGLHSTLFYLTSAFVSIYTGRLVDIKGSKWGLVISSSLMGILYILHSILPNFPAILFLAALTGLSISLNLPTVNKCIVNWFPQKQRSTALGIQSMAFPIGGLLGAVLLPHFGTILGWRKTIILPGLMALLIALFIYQFYREKKRVKNNLLEDNKNYLSFWQCFFQLLKNRELIKISVFGFFLGMMGNTITAHFTLFLFLDYNLSETVAGLGFAIVQLGSIIGRAAWGIFCDKILKSDKRKTFLYMGLLFFFTTMMISLVYFHLSLPKVILFCSAFLLGFSGYGWPGIFNASIAEVVEEENVGIAIGLASLFMRSGMMIAPPIFGYIADLSSSYSLSWFLLGIIMLGASFAQYYLATKKRKNLKSDITILKVDL